jgi:hypothetical protein
MMDRPFAGGEITDHREHAKRKQENDTAFHAVSRASPGLPAVCETLSSLTKL